jgi:hypothetical protein
VFTDDGSARRRERSNMSCVSKKVAGHGQVRWVGVASLDIVHIALTPVHIKTRAMHVMISASFIVTQRFTQMPTLLSSLFSLNPLHITSHLHHLPIASTKPHLSPTNTVLHMHVPKLTSSKSRIFRVPIGQARRDPTLARCRDPLSPRARQVVSAGTARATPNTSTAQQRRAQLLLTLLLDLYLSTSTPNDYPWL